MQLYIQANPGIQTCDLGTASTILKYTSERFFMNQTAEMLNAHIPSQYLYVAVEIVP